MTSPIVSLNQALDILYKESFSLPNEETISIFDAQDRILYEDIKCKIPLPSFTNSAMDGYAINSQDVGKKVQILGRILAGDNKETSIKSGQCYKIMTGALCPKGADAVVPIENVKEKDEHFILVPDIKNGANIRKKAEEKNINDIIASKGDKLTPQIVSLIASQGISTIKVFRKLKIAILSSGDELKEPWDNKTKDDFDIYNSNSICIYLSLKENGFDPHYIGIIKDDKDNIKQKIQSLIGYDVICTTGGVSVGEADYLLEALNECGMQKLFHGVNIKPGKPLLCGKINNTIIFGLPGNPISASITLNCIAMSALKKLQGNKEYYLNYLLAKNKEDIYIKNNKANIILGQIHNGAFSIINSGKYGSNMISIAASANAIAISGENKQHIKAQETIKVMPNKPLFSKNPTNFIND